MTRCPDCGNPRPSESEPCDVCPIMNESARAAGVSAGRIAEPVGAMPMTTADILSIDTAPSDAEAAHPAAAALPQQPEKDDVRTKSPVEPASAAGQEEITPQNLDRLRKQGVFIIVLLGFATAGKTFFLNRLKEQLSAVEGYNCNDRPRARQDEEVANTFTFTDHRFHRAMLGDRELPADFVIIDIPGERFRQAVENNFLRSDDALLRHVMLAAGAFVTLLPADQLLLGAAAAKYRHKNPATVVAADIEAMTDDAIEARIKVLEPLLKAAAKKVREKQQAANPGSIRSAKTVQANLKAEHKALSDVLLSRLIDQVTGQEHQLTEFAGGIGSMALFTSLLEKLGSPKLPDGFDRYAFADYCGSPERKPPAKPMFVVVSKIDLVRGNTPSLRVAIKTLFAGQPEVQRMLGDLSRPGAPLNCRDALSIIRPEIFKHVTGWFHPDATTFRYVSAFSDMPPNQTRIDYHLEFDGVVELIRDLGKVQNAAKAPATRRPFWDLTSLLKP